MKISILIASDSGEQVAAFECAATREISQLAIPLMTKFGVGITLDAIVQGAFEFAREYGKESNEWEICQKVMELAARYRTCEADREINDGEGM